MHSSYSLFPSSPVCIGYVVELQKYQVPINVKKRRKNKTYSSLDIAVIFECLGPDLHGIWFQIVDLDIPIWVQLWLVLVLTFRHFGRKAMYYPQHMHYQRRGSHYVLFEVGIQRKTPSPCSNNFSYQLMAAQLKFFDIQLIAA